MVYFQIKIANLLGKKKTGKDRPGEQKGAIRHWKFSFWNDCYLKLVSANQSLLIKKKSGFDNMFAGEVAVQFLSCQASPFCFPVFKSDILKDLTTVVVSY